MFPKLTLLLKPQSFHSGFYNLNSVCDLFHSPSKIAFPAWKEVYELQCSNWPATYIGKSWRRGEMKKRKKKKREREKEKWRGKGKDEMKERDGKRRKRWREQGKNFLVFDMFHVFSETPPPVDDIRENFRGSGHYRKSASTPPPQPLWGNVLRTQRNSELCSGTWKILGSGLYIGSGTSKNSELFLYIESVGRGKITSSSSIEGPQGRVQVAIYFLGLGKIPTSSPVESS